MLNVLKNLKLSKFILTQTAIVSLVFGCAIIHTNNVSLVGQPIQFDLSTDNYNGTLSFQFQANGLSLVNSEFTKIGGIESNTVIKKGKIITEYSPIELVRVYNGSDDLVNWRNSIENGDLIKKDITIQVLNSAFQVIAVYNLVNAWPNSLKTPGFEAEMTGTQEEIITFTFDSVTVTNP